MINNDKPFNCQNLDLYKNEQQETKESLVACVAFKSKLKNFVADNNNISGKFFMRYNFVNRRYVDDVRPLISAFENNPEIPQEFKSFALRYIEKYPFSRMLEENLAYPHVLLPTKEFFEKIAHHYKEKYGIRIEVCLDYELMYKLPRLKKEGLKEPIGIIVIDDDHPNEHVAPIICDFTGGKNSVINLDVMGFKSYKGPLQSKIRKYTSSGKLLDDARQRDQYTCRIDAPVILRNALLHIKAERKNNPDADLLSLTKSSGDSVEVPVEWRYTDQKTPKVFKEDPNLKTIVIRDLFSSKIEKRENPRSAIAFRQKHTETVTLKHSFELMKSRCEELPDFTHLPPNMSAEEVGHLKNHIALGWTVPLTVNTYMLNKGYRYALKFQEEAKNSI